MVEVELEPAIIPVISPQITTITEEDESKDEPKDEFKEEKTTIRKLWVTWPDQWTEGGRETEWMGEKGWVLVLVLVLVLVFRWGRRDEC